jgi:hypothetical protein
MKPLLAALILFSMTRAATIGVLMTSPNIPTNQLNIIAANIESELSETYQVIERQNLQTILAEQALSLSGATTTAISVGAILNADKMALVNVDYSGGIWSLCMKIIDVPTAVINDISCKAVQGSLDNCLAAARVLSGAPAVIRQVNHQVTVYEPTTTIIHKEMEGTKRTFQPCSFCQGTGYVPGPGHKGKSDCPMCSIQSRYRGPETHGLTMTGKWTWVK